jgi:zinc transporter ZupT
MRDADEFPTKRPLLATALTALVGAAGYVVPTALFGRAVEPLPTVAFAVGFTALYMGSIAVTRRVPELRDL